MTLIRRYLKTLLTVLALLVPIASWASGDSKKVVIDADISITEYRVKDNHDLRVEIEPGKVKAHITVTKDEFIISIPAQGFSEKYRSLPYEFSVPTLTIKGKCEVKEETYGKDPHVSILPKGEVSVTPASITFVDHWSRYSWNEEIKLTPRQEAFTESVGVISFFVIGGFATHGYVHIGLKYDSYSTTPKLAESNPQYTTYRWGDRGYNDFLHIRGEFEEVKVSEGDITASAEDDTEAPDEKGPWGTAIPAAVAAGIIGYLTHLINKLRKRRKANAKDQQDEDNSDDNDDEDDDDDEEPDQLEMRFYKDFDGTLITGDAAQRVSGVHASCQHPRMITRPKRVS